MSLSARECDQLTQRDTYEQSLPDSLSRLNAKTNQMIGQAITDFNRRFSGSSRHLSADEVERYLALIIHNTLGRESRVFLPQEEENVPYDIDILYSVSKGGKGPLQEWLEDPAIQGAYLEHLDANLYKDVYPSGFNDSCTVKVAGCLVGPDKIDHFLDQGYAYWRIGNYGADDKRAVDYGVASEWGLYGVALAGVFSFADLRANWAGYRFYKSLRSYFSIDSHQFMTQVKAFDWADWVDWQWDELLNPSALTPDLVQKMLTYAETQDRNILAGGHTYLATCLALQRGDLQVKRRRTSEYLNATVPFEMSTYVDLVGMIASGELVAQSGKATNNQ